MKASLKFRDDQKPLVRAKIPISVLGLSFLSGVSAGDARELCLDLATAFESGPSLRLSYRPNDPWTPFSLAVKTGIGAFGSPASAPFTMSAEFNLVGRGGPSFSIQLKPRFGDFCIRKTTRSAAGSTPPFLLGGASAVVDHDTDGECSADGAESPGVGFRDGSGMFAEKKPNGVSAGIQFTTAGGIRRFLSGTELTARSVLPLRSGTAVKFRWGVRVPSELQSGFGGDIGSFDPIGRFTLRKLPLLVMSKIAIEHIAREAKRPEKAATGEVAEACFSVQRQLGALQAENSTLRKVVEELQADLGTRKADPVAPGALTARCSRPEAMDRKAWEGNRSLPKSAESAKNGCDGGKKGNVKASETGGKATREDVNEELKKALMGATGAGI